MVGNSGAYTAFVLITEILYLFNFSLPGLGLIATRALKQSGIFSSTSRKASDTKIPMEDESPLPDKNLSLVEANSNIVRLEPKHLIHQIRNEPNLGYKITGTAGCWLLFDVLFYGNTLFQPVVFAAAFGNSETVIATVRDSLFISLISLPGYFTSVYMIGMQSPKKIQLQGFVMMSMLYFIIGTRFSGLAENRSALMMVYGLTFFFSNYGPNATVRF